jgi:hypothetical protein
MKKTLMGLSAVIVMAAAGYVGFQFYVQHRVVAEIQAAFDEIRSAGAKASHGEISYDPWRRTLALADIATETGTETPVSVKIAKLTASGVHQPESGRFAADLIEAADIEVGFTMITAGLRPQYTYKVPKIAIAQFSGSPPAQEPPASSSVLAMYRFALAQLAGIAASSVTIPTVSVSLKTAGQSQPTGEFTYSGIRIEGVKDGRIAESRIDKLVLAFVARTAGTADGFSGNFADLVMHDLDLTAVAALFDPQAPQDDGKRRVYREFSTGAYEVTSQQGVHLRVDGISVEDVAIRPQRLQLPALLAIAPPPGKPVSPAQARELLDHMATLYEGMSIGRLEVRGVSIEVPQGPLKLAMVRFGVDDGKGDIGIEGLEGRTPNGPFRLGRFTLKSLDMPKIIRLSAAFSNPAERPAADRTLELLRALEGAEVRDLVAPFTGTRKQLTIDTIDLNWGQFVGSIPTRLHFGAKLTTPLDAANPALLPLVAAGVDKAAIDADLGAAWSEASQNFAFEPVTIEISDMLKASARLSLANVPRGVFSTDLQQVTAAAAQIEAGALELTLRDLGALDILVAQYARAQNIGRDAARAAILENIRTEGEDAAAANPDAAAAVETLARFVETSRQTLVIRLTPRGKVPALQLLQLFQTEPQEALAQFRIESSTGL